MRHFLFIPLLSIFEMNWKKPNQWTGMVVQYDTEKWFFTEQRNEKIDKLLHI